MNNLIILYYLIVLIITILIKCLYSKICDDYAIIVCLYIDDLLILNNDMKCIIATKKFISSIFNMKDFEQVDTILGIKVRQHSEGFTLSQSYYIDKVLKKFNHLNIKEANNLIDPSIKLISNEGRAVAQLEYASVIGSLMYVA